MSVPKDKQYPMGVERQDVLDALLAVAQKKGSPLSEAEREAVYEEAFKK